MMILTQSPSTLSDKDTKIHANLQCNAKLEIECQIMLSKGCVYAGTYLDKSRHNISARIENMYLLKNRENTFIKSIGGQL